MSPGPFGRSQGYGVFSVPRWMAGVPKKHPMVFFQWLNIGYLIGTNYQTTYQICYKFWLVVFLLRYCLRIIIFRFLELGPGMNYLNLTTFRIYFSFFGHVKQTKQFQFSAVFRWTLNITLNSIKQKIVSSNVLWCLPLSLGRPCWSMISSKKPSKWPRNRRLSWQRWEPRWRCNQNQRVCCFKQPVNFFETFLRDEWKETST